MRSFFIGPDWRIGSIARLHFLVLEDTVAELACDSDISYPSDDIESIVPIFINMEHP